MRPSPARLAEFAAACALGAVCLLPASAVAAEAPLAPGSPWPKFRANLQQDGRARTAPAPAGRPWTFRTGKGIFSSPVIGADGTVYVGSADRVFYALRRDGRLRWRFRTGEIIDSAALLDDRGRVYVPSADGRLYALDARSGRRVWTFTADDPETTGAFIRWFEGNVAIGPDGTLYVPNDNFLTYAIDRDSGRVKWSFRSLDQTWSSPAYDARRDRVVLGSNFFLFGTPSMFSLDARTGERRWAAVTDGATVASPLVSGDRVFAGSFDGYLRAYDADSGRLLWRFGTRDHLYASPAEQPDGTIVQASADGSLYGLDPASGRLRWQHDTLAPIRSSPAVDARGRVYVGTGDRRLLVLNRDGSLRWSIRLARPPRGTLNASPALGREAIVIADSNGDIHSVPYDWCLRAAGRRDARCAAQPRVPREGARLAAVTPFGLVRSSAPREIGANQPLALQLDARRGGRARAAFLDPRTVRVRAAPATRLRVRVSGDRRHLVIVPRDVLRGGRVRLDVRAGYLVGAKRSGLAFRGGRRAGTVRATLRLRVRRGSAHPGPPVPVPASPEAPVGLWRMNRTALSLPGLLPSYNQIGFDRLEFLVSLVAPAGRNRAIAWMAGATGSGAADPFARWAVPFLAEWDERGQLRFTNEGGASFELNGFENRAGFWRMAARLDGRGAARGAMDLALDVDCAKIGFYGQALQGLGACTATRPMSIYGAALLRPAAPRRAPRGRGTVSYALEPSPEGPRIVARIANSTLKAGSTLVTVLAVDPRTNRPLSLDYSYRTELTADAAGNLTRVSVPAPRRAAQRLRVVLMVGATPYGPWRTVSAG